MIITKASGEKAVFSEEKLRRSLERSGAGQATTDNIIEKVKARLYEGISTKEIYRFVFSQLKKHSRTSAGRYNIKKGIMDLGPSGFPFEKYLAEIFRYRGYTAAVNTFIKGRCVTHEVDLLTTREGTRSMIECKFHNRRGTNCDVKIPLYVYSRFKDIEAGWLAEKGGAGFSNEGWVITNTRFSQDAIRYGNCIGLKLLGWNYPSGSNLQKWIDDSGLYPLTCLTTLTRAEKEAILAAGTVLCRDIPGRVHLLTNMGISERRIEHIVSESDLISSEFIDKNQS